jgi:hypothetical protein
MTNQSRLTNLLSETLPGECLRSKARAGSSIAKHDLIRMNTAQIRLSEDPVGKSCREVFRAKMSRIPCMLLLTKKLLRPWRIVYDTESSRLRGLAEFSKGRNVAQSRFDTS